MFVAFVVTERYMLLTASLRLSTYDQQSTIADYQPDELHTIIFCVSPCLWGSPLEMLFACLFSLVIWAMYFVG